MEQNKENLMDVITGASVPGIQGGVQRRRNPVMAKIISRLSEIPFKWSTLILRVCVF